MPLVFLAAGLRATDPSEAAEANAIAEVDADSDDDSDTVQSAMASPKDNGRKFVYVLDRSLNVKRAEQSPLEAAKAETIASLDTLENNHQFQIIFYNETPKAFKPAEQQGDLALVTQQNKERAGRFVESIMPLGQAEHEAAIKLALRMQPDVIFLLTAIGNSQLSDRQLYEIRRQAAGIQINTIEFGTGPKQGSDNFLAKLARQNSGQYAYRDITKAADDAGEPESAATSLKGRVALASDGSPVAGAEVRLLTWKHRGLDRTETTTNEKGEFQFTQLIEGRKTLAAYYKNLSSRARRYKGYEAKAGEEGIVLELREAPSLKVKVVTRAEGKPLENATVRLTWTDAKRDHKTDANGEVLIQGLTPETWTIESHALGFAEDVQAVNLIGTGTTSVISRVDPGIELYGVVRDEEGKGLADVGICVFPSGIGGGQIEYMETEANGSFRFPYLPVMGFTLIVAKEGYVEYRPDVTLTVSPGERQELNLTLPRRPDGGSVQGIIVNTDGKPVAGASVINRGSTIPRDTRQTTTDALGRYRLDDVFDSLGEHRLFISAKGYAPQMLDFEPGKRETPAELDVTLAPGHRLRGRVVDQHGNPLTGVQIYYGFSRRFSGSDHGGETTTDSEGRFELDSLSLTPLIEFRKGGYSSIRNETLALDGKDEVTVTMKSVGVIRGRVVDDRTGQPLTPFTVRASLSPDRKPDEPPGGLSRAAAFEGETFATKDATFRMAGLVQGAPLQITVTADGYDPAVVRRVVALAEQEAETVEFRLTPIDKSELISIAGRLVNEKKEPLPGAELRLIVATKRTFPRDGFPFNWTMIRSGQTRNEEPVLQFLVTATDPDGRFRFDKVRSARDIELVYWGEGVSQGRKAHLERLSAEELENLTITTETPGMVRGTIDRKAYPKISSLALSGHRAFLDVNLAAKGDSYEVRNVPAGRYELQLYVPSKRKNEYGNFEDDVIRRGPIRVTSGQTVTHNVEREPPATTPTSEPREPVPSNEAAKPPTPPSPQESVETMEQPQSDPADGRDEDQSEIAITGTVTDESGQPVSNAQLWLPLKFDESWMAEATTDKSGAFTLHVPVAWTEPGDFIPFWLIWCHAPNRQIATAFAHEQLRRKSRAPIKIVLPEATDTAFEVKDPQGKPVQGAKVEPFHFRAGSYYIISETLRERLTKQTDAEGRVWLPEIGRDRLSNVRVTADGYGIQELRLRDSADEPAMRTIDLRTTGRLEGRLVSDNPSAIKNVRLHLYQEDYIGQATSGAATIQTDEDGRFVVPAFAEGEIKLIFEPHKSIPLRPRIPDNLEIIAGETTRVDVPMERTVRVRGRVQTKGEAAPVAGCTISVQYGTFRQSEHVRTDGDGWFEADALAGPVRRQLIMKPDQYSDWIVEQAGWQNPIEVPNVETFELPALELIETTEVVGHLVDRDGNPVPKADLRAITGNRVYAWATSDSDGKFTLRLPAGFHVEEYDVARTHDEPPLNTSVKKESPLVLQLVH